LHHEEGRNPKEVGRLVARRCDVTDEVAVSTLLDTVQAQFGPLDVLVNSAGVASQSSCVDLSLAEWDRVLGTNLTGTFLCNQAALRQMLPAKRGSIVNVASQASKRGLPLLTHYCASKAGVPRFCARALLKSHLMSE
jgi:NAD(P)-dependent dehydrogenase (short-subunit alcohol dehydrogenase family)